VIQRPTRRAALPPPALASLLAGLAALALVAGCTNPFQPATPEQPSGAGIVENFTTPDELLSTMQLGIQARSAVGRQAYLDAIADSTSTSTPAYYAFPFITVLDAWDQSNPAPPPWTKDMEQHFYDWVNENYFATQNYTYSLTWSPDNLSPADNIDLNAGTALVHRHYELIASSPDGAVNSIVTVGYADLYMVREGGRWELYRWEDRLDPDFGLSTDFPSMGYLRLDSKVWT